MVTEDFLARALDEDEGAPGEGRPAVSRAVCQAVTSCSSAPPPPPDTPPPPISGAMAEEGEAEVPSGKMMWTPVRWVICKEWWSRRQCLLRNDPKFTISLVILTHSSTDKREVQGEAGLKSPATPCSPYGWHYKRSFYYCEAYLNRINLTETNFDKRIHLREIWKIGAK